VSMSMEVVYTISMLILAALAITQGRAISRYKSAIDQTEAYPLSVKKYINFFTEEGVDGILLRDLDGEKAGEPRQTALFTELTKSTRMPLWMAGGVTTPLHADALFRMGASRVVVGSSALTDSELLPALMAKYGAGRIVAELLTYESGTLIVADGTRQKTKLSLIESAAKLAQMGLKTLIVTDTQRTDTLTFPDFDAIEHVVREVPELQLISRGGIAKVEHIAILERAGAYGVTLSRALLMGDMTMQDIRNTVH